MWYFDVETERHFAPLIYLILVLTETGLIFKHKADRFKPTFTETHGCYRTAGVFHCQCWQRRVKSRRAVTSIYWLSHPISLRSRMSMIVVDWHHLSLIYKVWELELAHLSQSNNPNVVGSRTVIGHWPLMCVVIYLVSVGPWSSRQSAVNGLACAENRQNSKV